MVFTEYAETLDWIVRVLGQQRLPGRRASSRSSRARPPAEEREDIRAKFTAPPDKQPVRVLVATDSAGEGIDLQAHCHRLVNFDIPFNPSRLEQRIGRIDRYGQEHTPEIYQLVPGRSGLRATRRTSGSCWTRSREKIGQVAADLGSVNEVIDADIQDHFTPGGTGRKVKLAARDDGSVIINRVLAGGQELNRTLTELSRTYDDRKAEMHLTPGERAARRGHRARADRPAAAAAGRGRRTRRRSSRSRRSARRGSSRCAAWRPGSNPGVLRPVTFDEKVGRGTGTTSSTSTSGTRCCSARPASCASALFNVDSPVHRVTAVVADGLPQSCVAAVSRLVLVGLGGLRLHEEVFLTGIRLARQRHGRGEGRGGPRPGPGRPGPGPRGRGRPPPARGPVERRRRAAARPGC